MSRYIIRVDPEREEFRIIDTGTVIGGEDSDYVWTATAYELADAQHICQLLNENPASPVSK